MPSMLGSLSRILRTTKKIESLPQQGHPGFPSVHLIKGMYEEEPQLTKCFYQLGL